VERIRSACKSRRIYAVVGAPKRDGDQVYCAALVIDPDGDIIDSYEKIYLAGEQWAAPGRTLSTYRIDGTMCGTFICHDERYPHLVQLRALAGAQLFFYISCESGMAEEHKIAPYRAQVQARAVENGVYLVHANAPGRRSNPSADGTSNGHSRIIAPDGNIIREAGPYDEEMVVADIDMRHVRKRGDPRVLSEGPTATWLRDGLRHVVGK
jgi:predicted amidohydrolase